MILDDLLKFRHGLTPTAKNIASLRHKSDPQPDKAKVAEVETILKDLIETGFAHNCEEELLHFDDDG